MTDLVEKVMDHRPPIYISFMLSCFYSANPEANIGSAQWNSEAGKDVREWLVREGLVEMPNYASTSRGRAWVNYICKTPLPEQHWTLPDR